jgi:hypothetical protein
MYSALEERFSKIHVNIFKALDIYHQKNSATSNVEIQKLLKQSTDS